jgi:uncharacterized membrane protein
MSTAAPLEKSDEYPAPSSAMDEPSRTDGFVRGLSEAVGGPLGDFAVRPGRSAYGGPRFWSAARVVLALVCLTLSLHWVQKFPCNDGAWSDLKQYKYFCYTDVLALYYAEGLSEGSVPYRDHPVEYPVVTGAFMGALGLPVHALGGDNSGLNQGQLFYNLNVLALGALAVATAALLLAVRRRRPWDIAMFAVSPGLFLSATVNWDLLAVGLTAIGWYFWARRRPALAGVLIGLAASAKLWPALLAVPVLALCMRTGKLRAFGTAALAGLATIIIVNVPVALQWPDSWAQFFRLNSQRPIDWGSFWYIGNNLPRGNDQYGLAPFQWLSNHIPVLNLTSWILIVLALFGVVLLTIRAPRRPRLAQIAFLTIAVFLLFNKVWSQQFVLWLIPFVVLARPRWGAFVAWQSAEVAYFAAFYGRLMNESGKNVFPEWVFVLAASLRMVMLCVLIGLVIREIRRPELDVVRRSYEYDPDGGLLNDPPDDGDPDVYDEDWFGPADGGPADGGPGDGSDGGGGPGDGDPDGDASGGGGPASGDRLVKIPG